MSVGKVDRFGLALRTQEQHVITNSISTKTLAGSFLMRAKDVGTPTSSIWSIPDETKVWRKV